MEYKIISGRTVEIRRVYMAPGRNRAVRRGLRAKKSSLKKISANERDAVLRLARTINANFERGDLWVTLTYGQDLPSSAEEAEARLVKFMRRLRGAMGRQGQQLQRYVIATGTRDSETGEPVRLHHHLILPGECKDLLFALWPADDITVRYLDGRGDHTALARYIVQNTTTGEHGGKRRYSTAKGMKKPIVTEPVPVRLRDRLRVPSDCNIRANELLRDEDAPWSASLYLRYVRAREPSGRYRDVKLG